MKKLFASLALGLSLMAFGGMAVAQDAKPAEAPAATAAAALRQGINVALGIGQGQGQTNAAAQVSGSLERGSP